MCRSECLKNNTNSVTGGEADRVTNEPVFVLLDLHHLLGLDVWCTVVVDDANASTQLQG